MRSEILFNGPFSVEPRRTLTPGAWYLGFTCTHCGKDFAILDEPTATGALDIGGQGIFAATCPSCGTRDSYPADRLKTFQAAVGGMTSPA